MAGYIGTQAVSVNTTSATISDDLTVGDNVSLTSDSAVLNIGAGNDLKITHDGTNGDFESAGNLTFDVAGDIILDADGGDVNFKDAGTEYLRVTNGASGPEIFSTSNDGDLFLKGVDGGATITALTLDMSDAGTAIFNHDIKLSDNGRIIFGAGADLAIYSDGTNGRIEAPNGDLVIDLAGDIILDVDGGDVRLKDGGTEFLQIFNNSTDAHIYNPVQDKDILFQGNDGGSTVTALTLDMSDAGSASFNHDIFLNQGGAKLRFGSSQQMVMFHDESNAEIDVSSGNLTLDVAGNIFLNADGSLIIFSDAAVEYGRVGNSSSDFAIQALVQDKDIQFKGNDNGSIITALTLDMSDVGSATFNGSTRAPFGLFGEIYEVTNGADISLTKVSEDSGIAVSCRSATNGHTPYVTFQKTPATSGNYTATASGDFLGLLNFKGVNTSGASNEGARIQVVQNGALSGSVPATMIIEASGQAQLHMAANSTSGAAVCIGGTAVSRRLDVRSTNITTAGFFYQDASDVPLIQLGHSRATGSNTATMIQLQNAAGTEKGSIKTTTSASSFNTSSDYRLKENVNYSWDATTRLKQLKPARFNWIEDDTNTLLDGFMAHEVTSVVPEATDGAKDGVKTVTNAVLNSFGNVLAEDVTEADWTAGKIALTDADGNEVAEATYPSNTSWTASKEMPVYQQIDQSKLVPLLVKTIQELEARITALEG